MQRLVAMQTSTPTQRPNSATEIPKVLLRMRNELKEGLEEQENLTKGESRPVFWMEDLQRIITTKRLRRLFQHHRYNKKDAKALAAAIVNGSGRSLSAENKECNGDGESGIQDNFYVKIVGILIYIEWTRWRIFEDIFFKSTSGRSDNDLPLGPVELESLKKLDIFDNTLQFRAFRDDQYKFIPATIVNDKLQNIQAPYILPYCSPGVQIGKGSFGAVYKYKIRKEHVPAWHSHDETISGYQRKYVEVAVKVLPKMQGQLQELKNLQIIQTSVHSTKHLVMLFGAYTDERNLYIIFPLAKMDLKSYLTSAKDGQALREKTQFDHRQPDLAFFQEVFVQLRGIAHALDFLHRLINPHKCAHMDLTLANILVFPPETNRVGTWKITDLGISKMKRTLGRECYPDTRTKKSSDLYCAPEAASSSETPWPKVGIEGDIWSMGVIFFMVLNCLLGKDLSTLEKQIEGTGCASRNFYIIGDKNEAHINPEVSKILKKLYSQSKSNDTWLFLEYSVDLLRGEGCVEIIEEPLENKDIDLENTWQGSNRGMLVIQAKHRIAAESLASKFQGISEHLGKLAKCQFQQKEPVNKHVVNARACNGIDETLSLSSQPLNDKHRLSRYNPGREVQLFKVPYTSRGLHMYTIHKSFISSCPEVIGTHQELEHRDALDLSVLETYNKRPQDEASDKYSIATSGYYHEQGSSLRAVKSNLVFNQPVDDLQKFLKCNPTKVVLANRGNLAAFVHPDRIILYLLYRDAELDQKNKEKCNRLKIGNIFSFKTQESWEWVDAKVHNSLFVGMLQNKDDFSRKKLIIYTFPDNILQPRLHHNSDNPEEVILSGDASFEMPINDETYIGFHIMNAGQLVRVYQTCVLVQWTFSITSSVLQLNVLGQIDSPDWVSISANMDHLAIFYKSSNPFSEDLPMRFWEWKIDKNGKYNKRMDFYCSKTFFSLRKFAPFSTTMAFIAWAKKREIPQNSSAALFSFTFAPSHSEKQTAGPDTVQSSSAVSYGQLLQYDHRRTLDKTTTPWTEILRSADVVKIVLTENDCALFVARKQIDSFEIMVFQVNIEGAKIRVEKKGSIPFPYRWIEGSDFVVQGMPNMDYYIIVANPVGRIQAIKCISFCE